MTPGEAARVFRGYLTEMDRTIINGIRRWQGAVRTETVKRFRTRGIGRSIFGKHVTKSASGVRVMIKRTRVRKEGRNYRADMTLIGLAALQEVGGRTKPHQIKSHRPSGLLSRGRGAGFVASTKKTSVQHPGSNIARRPSFVPAAQALEPRLAVEIDKGLSELAVAKGLAGPGALGLSGRA